MPNKVQLTEQAQALGITVDPEWTKAQIVEAIKAHENEQDSGNETIVDARQELLARAAELKIEGAAGMNDEQLAVVIEQAEKDAAEASGGGGVVQLTRNFAGRQVGETFKAAEAEKLGIAEHCQSFDPDA